MKPPQSLSLIVTQSSVLVIKQKSHSGLEKSILEDKWVFLPCLFIRAIETNGVIFTGAILPLKKLLRGAKWKSEVKLMPDFNVTLETSLINL